MTNEQIMILSGGATLLLLFGAFAIWVVQSIRDKLG